MSAVRSRGCRYVCGGRKTIIPPHATHAPQRKIFVYVVRVHSNNTVSVTIQTMNVQVKKGTRAWAKKVPGFITQSLADLVVNSWLLECTNNQYATKQY